jgi:hypothetical protein
MKRLVRSRPSGLNRSFNAPAVMEVVVPVPTTGRVVTVMPVSRLSAFEIAVAEVAVATGPPTALTVHKQRLLRQHHYVGPTLTGTHVS